MKKKTNESNNHRIKEEIRDLSLSMLISVSILFFIYFIKILFSEEKCQQESILIYFIRTGKSNEPSDGNERRPDAIQLSKKLRMVNKCAV